MEIEKSQSIIDEENENLESQDHENKEIVERAKERFSSAVSFWSESRLKAMDDVQMRVGNHWPSAELAKRQLAGRPTLTVNKIPQFCRQISNEMRQNKMSIKVNPVDDQGDIETAKIYQGIIRNIEYSSNASLAYIGAGESAVEKSFGFFRITNDYVSPDSFDQEIRVRGVANPFSVQIDPSSVELDGCDMTFAFIAERLSKTEFKAQYPKSDIANSSDWLSYGANKDWIDDESVTVCEYYEKSFEEKEIYLLENGEVVDAENYETYMQFLATSGQQLIGIKNKRKAQVPKVMWYKLNGVEILESTEIPCSYIPLIPVYGGRVFVDGKWILESVHRYAQDSQKMLNYYTSSEAESIALAPKAPWLADAEQVAGFEQQWKTANSENYSILLYNAVSKDGQLLPAPSRNNVDPAIGAVSSARAYASEDIKATTGIYDPSLGAKSNETSGRAILARNQQAQTSNYHFVDNLSISIQHAGRIMVEMIPRIYDAERAVRILGENDEREIIFINKEFERNGEVVKYDLSKGKYDVVVDVGPSYATKRQEAAEAMVDFSKAMPQQAPLIADLMVKSMDWPMAQEIGDRLKKMLPPELQDNQGQAPKIPPQVVSQIKQYEQLIDQLTEKVKEMSEVEKTKILELESNERIAYAKLQSAETIELAKLESKEALTVLQNSIADLEAKYNSINIEYEQPFEDSQEFVGNQADVIPQDNQQMEQQQYE